MSDVTTLATLDNAVQLGLRNLTNSPFSQSTRVNAYNRVIDFLQSKANWDCCKRVVAFDYLPGETDYSLANALGITDFKQYKDLRKVTTTSGSQLSEFDEIDNADFAVWAGQNALVNRLTFEDRDNDKIMRVLTSIGSGVTVIDEMDSLATGRTWASDTSGSDATTLSLDTTRVKSGSGTLKFNISVSQSAQDYASISTTTVFSTTIDASNLLNTGYFRFWLGLHSFSAANLALISSVQFIWGSSSSAYWSKTATTTINGGSFTAGWNRLSFDWATATQTGSPNEAALAYFKIVINYSSSLTNSNNVRVDRIEMFDPVDMELVYFSTNMVLAGSTRQDHFSTGTITTTEQLLFPRIHLNLFINLALQILWPQKTKSNEDYIRVINEIKTELPLAINQSGEAITREVGEMDLEGNSSGRVEYSQW